MSSFGFSSGCIRPDDITKLSILAGVGDTWFINTILVSGQTTDGNHDMLSKNIHAFREVTRISDEFYADLTEEDAAYYDALKRFDLALATGIVF